MIVEKLFCINREGVRNRVRKHCNSTKPRNANRSAVFHRFGEIHICLSACLFDTLHNVGMEAEQSMEEK
jgi:hypothetical protein